MVNPLTPNNHYSSRTAPLTSKGCILYIYSTNIGTEYFKHSIYSPHFSLQNAVCFIILTYLVPVLFTFYIQDVLKQKKNSGAKRLMAKTSPIRVHKHRLGFQTFSSLTERSTQVTGHDKTSETTKYTETFRNEFLGKTARCKYFGRHTDTCGRNTELKLM